MNPNPRALLRLHMQNMQAAPPDIKTSHVIADQNCRDAVDFADVVLERLRNWPYNLTWSLLKYSAAIELLPFFNCSHFRNCSLTSSGHMQAICTGMRSPSESPRWVTNRSRHLTHVTLSGSRDTMVMPHNVITLFSGIAVLPIYPAINVIANKYLQSFASLTNRSEGLTSLPSKWLLWRVHETPSSLGEISTKTSRVWLQDNPDGKAQAWLVCSMEQCVIGYLFLNKYGYCGVVQETHH